MISFDRDKLIEAADFLIKRYEDRESRRKEAFDAMRAEQAEAWKEHGLPAWRAFRDELTKALKSGTVITEANLKHRKPAYFRPEGTIDHFRYKGEDFARHQDLNNLRYVRELRQMLEYCDGKKVSSADLKTLGYPMHMIQGILANLDQEKAKVRIQEKLRAAEEKKAATAAEKKEAESK